METNHHIWRVWANVIHRWGIQNLVASFLEAAGPLSLIGAQMIYIGQPILRGILPAGHLSAMKQHVIIRDETDADIAAMSKMLEDDSQREEFVTYLLEETP